MTSQAIGSREFADEARKKRGMGYLNEYNNYHSLTCLCEVCTNLYNAHMLKPGQQWFHENDCPFCRDHRYAIQRVERADKNGVPTMSTVNICNRCEAMGLGRAMGQLQYVTAVGSVWSQALDLCPGCIESFLGWLEAGEGEDRPNRAYKEPYSPEEAAKSGPSKEDVLMDALNRATLALEAVAHQPVVNQPVVDGEVEARRARILADEDLES